jgi:uncharacterized protein (TIGR00369 family)
MTGLTDDQHLDRARALVSDAYHYLGLAITGGGAGRVEVTLTVREELLNADGVLHGGMWAVVADSAMGGALRTMLDPEVERAVTAQLDIRWLRPAQGTTLRAAGRLTRRGRMLSHCAADLFDVRDELVGTATATFVVVRRDEPD